MTTPDDSTRRPEDEPFAPSTPPGATPVGQTGRPTTTSDEPVLVTTDDADDADLRDDDELVVTRSSTGGGSAGPGLALAGVLAGLVALLTAVTESAVRECVPDPVGSEAMGADGFLTALLLAVVAVVLSAVGIVLSRSEGWGAAVGVAGVVVGVLVVVVWLLSVWLLAAEAVDITTASQEAALPLQGYGCA
ncbi:hypothetical protein [Pseudokineococcus lusitanus]|uniref:Uncharacterized protein n=1 Tax=Pseudokineococcus lusitanus TaxID=763993 RepID=A0A3N1HL39_9ACTN|nr:hypothetical protein [Pseudokineococcus lusitanus]ROP43238.1 hypothetical protein EDC03_1836 [Pseudokineococcus lusitanus]